MYRNKNGLYHARLADDLRNRSSHLLELINRGGSVSEKAIQSTLQENRVFPPAPEFSARAHIKSMAEYSSLWKKSIDQPEQFWSEIASQLHWFQKWNTVLEWKAPDAKWFVGGKTNLAYNCLERQIENGKGDQTAILFEGEQYADGKPSEVRKYRRATASRSTCP
jgi:acetyl-CoA synthetase